MRLLTSYSHRFAFLVFCVLFLSSFQVLFAQSIVPLGPTTFCQGGSVTLTTNPTGTAYQWQLDGTNTVTTSSYTVNQSGVVTVTVDGTVYGPLTITAAPIPNAAFSFSPNNLCASEPVVFTNTSSGNGLSYSWNFGDPNSGSNNTSNATNPTHRFVGTPGNGTQSFTVTLTVTSADGCTHTATQTVTTKQLPETKLVGTGITTYDGKTYFTSCSNAASVSFDFVNQSTTSNTSYKIIWGDGSADFVSANFSSFISHTYFTGTYTLLFVVEGQNGCKDTGLYYVFVGSNPQVGYANPGNSSICTGSMLTFPISNTSQNPPGTVYTVSYNDGTPSTTYQHPPPTDVTHQFLINSCGAIAPGYQNSFSTTIRASNPCNTSQVVVSPIYVSEKPTAAITVSPRDTVCVNSAVTITNTSGFTKYINNSGGCDSGKIIWKITPSTGYTFTGALGSDFGSNNLDLWSTGSRNLILNFTSTGTYSIKIKIGNPKCGIDSVIKTICVNPTPVGGFTIDNNIGCAPLNVTTTNTSNTPNCGSNTYGWSVTYTSTTGCTPNSSGYTYVGGTSATSTNPQFQFTNPGVYTIRLVTKSSNGACTATEVTRVVTVKAKPIVTITAAATTCQGQSVSPTATVSCYTTGATYAWTFTGGSPASSTAATPGNVTYAIPGTYTIQLAVTNECGTTIVTKQIVVNPSPNVIVPSNMVLCRGGASGTITFSSNLTGTTYTWTNSNTAIGLGSTGSGNIGSFNATNTGIAPITGTITVTPVNGCNGTPATFTITVYPIPPAPTATTPVIYCQNAVATPLTATAIANHTLNWYTSATGGTASTTAPTPLTSTVGTTTYYVSQVNTGGCESSPRTPITVTVNAVPVISAVIPANPTGCGTTTGSLTINGLIANSVYSVSYTKNGTLVNLTNQTATTLGSILISNLTSGTYANIKVTRNNCTSNEMGPYTLSDPSAPVAPTAGSNSPVCSGGTINFTANTIAGATYNWSGPGFSTSSSSQNPILTNVPTAATGTYSVTVTVNGCTSPAGTIAVVVNPTPANITATSNGPVCSGQTLQLNASSSTTVAVTYAWTGPNSFTSSVQNPSILLVTAAAGGTYSVTATLGNCSAAPKTVTVVVNPTPAITDSSFASPTSCTSANGTIRLMGLANNTTYSVSYQKNGTPVTPVNIATSAAGELIITGLSAGTYSNITITLAGCTSRAIGPFVLLAPNPPATPTAGSNGPVCSGTALNLTASTITGATYNWSGPNGFSNTTQNPTIANVSTAASGTYSVTATVSGCISAAGTIAVVVNPTPANITATSNGPVCSGQTLQLNASSTTTGTVTYAWTGPNSFNSSVQNPSIPLVTATAGGTYSVTATLGSCSAAPKTVAVVVNPTPAITDSSFASPTSCTSANGTISLMGLANNTTYSVSYQRNGTPFTTTILTSTSGVLALLNLSAGTYSNITLTLTGCTSRAIGPFVLVAPNPPATPTATSNSPVCSGDTLKLTASTATAGTATYTWTGPGSYSNTSQSPLIPNVALTAGGTYTVTATINGCVSAAATVAVIINPTPTLNASISNSSICSGQTLQLNASSNTSGAVTYAWTGPNGFASNQQNPTITNAPSAAAGIYTVIATLGSCSATPKTVTAVVNPTPVINDSSFTNPTSCTSATGSISLSTLAPNVSYTVTYLRNGTASTATITSSASGILTIPNLTAGTYSNVRVAAATGCSSNTVGPFVLSDPNPPVAPVAASNGPVCSGDTLKLTANTTSVGVATYNWSGPNGFTSANQNPDIIGVTTGASGTYTVTATISGCTSTAGTVTVVINQTPAGVSANSNSPICSSQTLQLTSGSSSPGSVTYAWTGPNGFTSNLQNPTISNATIAAGGIYTVTATLGSCSAAPKRDTVTVNPKPFISDSSFTNPTSCTSSTGTIILKGLANNSSYTVTYTRNAGAPVTTSLLSNASGELTIPNLTAGTYSNVQVTTGAGCLSNIVGPFTLTDPNPPATPTATSNAPTICSGSPLSLSANTTTAGAVTYSWTGPGGYSSNNQNPIIPSATVANSGTYVVTATISGCTSPATSVAVVVVPNAATANAGADQQICNGPTYTLAANNPGVGIGTWTVIAPSTATISQVNNPASPVINLPLGITQLVWTITNSVCQPTRDTVTITNLPAVTNHVSPLSNTICTGQSSTINGINPVGGSGNFTYQWQQSSNNVVFTNISGAISPDLTVSPTVTTYYRRVVTSGVCTSFGDTAIITVLASISGNNISSNQTICINTAPALLSGALPAGGGGSFSYSWEQSTDNGITWTPIAGATGQDYQPGVLSVLTMYRRYVVTALCSGAQTSVSNNIAININPDARAVFNPTITQACTPFVITPAIINIAPYNNAVIEYRWYVNNNYIGSGQAFPGYTINMAGDSVTVKLVAVSRFGCKNDSTQHGFKTIPPPAPAFTLSDSVGCGPLSVTFTNQTPNAAQYSYRWNFGTGQTSTLQQPSVIVFPPNPRSGDTVYTVTLTAISPCDTISTLRYVRVKSRPKVLFTPDRTNSCSGYNFTFTNTSAGIGNTYVWDFGDGSPLLASNAAQVTHVYHTGNIDTFNVKLKATNECGSDSLIYNVIVQPITIRLDFAINGNERFGCLPHTVRFINNSQGAGVFYWNFGDGSPVITTNRNIDTVTHIYTTAGNFITTLRGTNSCSDTSDIELVTVYPKPLVSFTANPLVACFGDTIRFTNLSDTGIAYNWRFGDATTSVQVNPVKVYTTGGTYRVWLTGTRANPSGLGCSDSSYKDIIIRDTLAGSFTASDTILGCIPATITFKNDNRPSFLTTWNFGDGSPAVTGDSVGHTYLQTGSYTVTMISKGIAGCTYKATKTIIITNPAGTLLYAGGYLCPNTPFRMEVVPNSSTTLIRYVFGDGDSLTTTNTVVFHNYGQPGMYVPHAYVMAGACRVRLVRGDTVKVERMRTGFRFQQQQQCGVTTVTFTDTSFAFFGIQSRRWDFGDATFSLAQNPVKIYTQSGTYNVRLRITGISGCVDTLTIPVTVSVRNIPVSTISGDSMACLGQPLSLNALVQSADSIVSVSWNFGNGVPATGQNVSALYNTPGTYTVRLISRTAFGCADTVYKTIRVNPVPIVNAGPDVRICRGNSIQLGAVGAATWQWSPLQNLSCVTCPNPVANPLFTTNYVVTGSNAAGCRTSDSITVEVVQPFTMTVSPTDTLCIGDSVQLFSSGGYSYTWNPAVSLDNAAISNPIAKPTITTVYQVVGKDRYNCFTDTDYVRINVGQYPTVDLGTGALVTAGTSIRMNPVITNGPIVRYTWTPATLLSCANCPQPTAVINKDIFYRLEVENNWGCKGWDTIGYRVNCDPAQVFIPNAFSPDGDGTNDVLMVRGKGVATVKYFRIFNRWGQLVFERSNVNVNDPQQGWDGTVNGKPAQPDVYVYTAEAVCTGGGTFVYKGNVTLVR